jgi:hypothetical protein
MPELVLTNAEIERIAIEYVMDLERDAGREPQDVHLGGVPYDVLSPPRKIEVKAFGKSARGAQLPLEDSQVQAAKADPKDFYVYVVDNVMAEAPAKIAVRVLHGATLMRMIDRTAPHITYWPTLRTAEYDQISEGIE